jgi:hypothetical protein
MDESTPQVGTAVFVFDAFYVNFVRGALAKVSGELWLVEYQCFTPRCLWAELAY